MASTANVRLSEIARSNAQMAIDQRHDRDYSSLGEVLDSYYENVRDSLIEEKLNVELDASYDAYRKAVRAEAKRLGISLSGTGYGRAAKIG